MRRGSVTRRKVFAGSRLGGDDVKAPRKTPKSDADRAKLRSALREGTLLGALSNYELDEMIDFMDVVSLKQGQECDLGGCLCVVLEGEVQAMTSAHKDLEERDKKRFTSGTVFGQVGLFDDSSASGGLLAQAGRAAKVCKLQGTAYRRGMEFSRQAHIKANMKLLSTVPIFKNLSVTERLQISDSSEVRTYCANEPIITEGEPGEHFYVLRSGGATVSRGIDKTTGKPKRIDYKYPGDYFGEAALLDNQPRNATVVAAEPGTDVLRVDRALFNKQLLGPLSTIMARDEKTVQQQMLVTVPLLSELTAEKRNRLIGCLKLETFRDGAYIFKQGDLGDRMYIVKKGAVSVLVKGTASGRRGESHIELDQLTSGEHFGERALIKEEPRMASALAAGDLECYSLSKDDFDELNLQKHVAWSRRWDIEDTRDTSLLQTTKTLGAGAFGTAWLVRHSKTGKEYALKSLDKQTVKRQNWTSVVMREKDILASLSSSPHPCVITMHNAFQTPSHLFMLMEIATGGELFTLLEKFNRFQPEHALFYAGNVVLAIGHLHKHGIIFRDLKPENLLLDGRGYLKLIDMGFAKRLAKGEKTYTLCGTPYYLAPEMILHRGHDLALDWWTVGVLTYEMLEGEPPFTGNSEMEVYGKVTRMQYTCPPKFPELAVDLIRQLLKKEPESRLGNLRNGVNDVMSHPWFHSLSWDDLYDGKLTPPYLPPKSNGNGSSGNSRQKSLDLREVIKSSDEYGHWPGWNMEAR